MSRRTRKKNKKNIQPKQPVATPLPTADVTELQKLGAAFFEQGDIAKAIGCFEQAYTKDKTNSEVAANLALLLSRADQANKAIDVLHSSLEHQPENSRLHFLAGTCHVKNKDYAQACAHFEKVLAKTPDDVDALVNMAIARHEQGRLDEAEKLYKKAVRLRPDAFAPVYNLARLLLNSSRFHEAAQMAQKAAKLQPASVGSLQILGLAQLRLKNYPAAEQVFAKIIKAEPDSIDAKINLCVLYDETGQAEKGYNLLAPFADSWPEKLSVHAALLNSAVSAGFTSKAASHGRTVLEIKHAAAIDKLAGLQAAGHALCLSHAEHANTIDVLAFSLWGDADFYNIGAIENARLAKEIYPGWIARFYIDETVPQTTADALEQAGAEVVKMPPRKTPFEGLMWRFKAANDTNVRNFMCRDCDCRLNARERAAVDEWLTSGKDFLVMRDHACHAELILAGLWGGKAGLLPDVQTMIAAMPQVQYDRWGDQTLLANIVWPLVYKNTLVFDSTQTGWLGARNFPAGTKLPDGANVGDAVRV